MNSGRIQINLKPLEERKVEREDVIRRLQPELAKVDGITLFMQPVQDLTVEDRVSRTQFQYSLEDPDPRELSVWVPRFLAKLQTLPELRDVASDQQNAGPARPAWSSTGPPRRGSGITPQMLDDALYDAFGQRQISTMFTQLNQYRVVLEAQPGFQDSPEDLKNVYLRSSGGGSVPLGAFTEVRTSNAPLAVNHQGQFPVVTVSFNLAPGASLGEAVRAIEQAQGGARPAREHPGELPGNGAGLPGVADEHAVPDPRGDRHGLHPARRAVRELHPPGHDPVDAPVRRRGRASLADAVPDGLLRHRADRHHPADRDRREERDHDDRLRARRRAQGEEEAGRRDLTRPPPALPPDPDDDDGRAARRRPPRARVRDRLGAAAAARHRDRRAASSSASS